MLDRLKHFDLNTLLALEALLDLKHVSRAASRMNISQPAMSRTLAKLRDAFDDPLLVRVNMNLELTERAATLQEPLKRILFEINDLMQPMNFDPASSQRSFKIALTDFSAQVFLPHVLPAIYKEAPNVQIETLSLRSGMLTGDAFSEIDASICNPYCFGPFDLSSWPLFEIPSVVLMSRNHPLAKQKMTLDRYLKYPHVEVGIGGNPGTKIDELLSQLGRQREIGFRSAHVIAILAILEKTDLLFTIGWQLLQEIGKGYSLTCKPVPLDLPMLEYSVVWHPKNKNSASNIWFRELLISAINKNIQPNTP